MEQKNNEKESFQNFWYWFLKHEKEFFETLQNNINIDFNFFNKITPKLNEIHSGIYVQTRLLDKQTIELILTPFSIIRNIYIIEELIHNAPQIKGWKFTALKPPFENAHINYGNLEFISNKLKFYPNEHENYPDMIDLTIVYDDFEEDKITYIMRGLYMFLNSFLGELNCLTLIDDVRVVGT